MILGCDGKLTKEKKQGYCGSCRSRDRSACFVTSSERILSGCEQFSLLIPPVPKKSYDFLLIYGFQHYFVKSYQLYRTKSITPLSAW